MSSATCIDSSLSNDPVATRELLQAVGKEVESVSSYWDRREQLRLLIDSEIMEILADSPDEGIDRLKAKKIMADMRVLRDLTADHDLTSRMSSIVSVLTQFSRGMNNDAGCPVHLAIEAVYLLMMNHDQMRVTVVNGPLDCNQTLESAMMSDYDLLRNFLFHGFAVDSSEPQFGSSPWKSIGDLIQTIKKNLQEIPLLLDQQGNSTIDAVPHDPSNSSNLTKWLKAVEESDKKSMKRILKEVELLLETSAISIRKLVESVHRFRWHMKQVVYNIYDADVQLEKARKLLITLPEELVYLFRATDPTSELLQARSWLMAHVVGITDWDVKCNLYDAVNYIDGQLNDLRELGVGIRMWSDIAGDGGSIRAQSSMKAFGKLAFSFYSLIAAHNHNWIPVVNEVLYQIE